MRNQENRNYTSQCLTPTGDRDTGEGIKGHHPFGVHLESACQVGEYNFTFRDIHPRNQGACTPRGKSETLCSEVCGYVCVCVCGYDHASTSSPTGERCRMTLELKLQEVMNHLMWGLGIKLGSFERGESTLNP